ncbi:MAG: hypothetical protein IJC16_08950 [Rikenellaceae bacterium]|nr:hypothetical protein [Rikenellaceae bacterium]
MKRLTALILLTLACPALYGQEADGPVEQSELLTELMGAESDMELFFQPLESYEDLFTRLSRYNFSAVRYNRRGYDARFGRTRASALDLADPFRGDVNWTIVNALRLAWHGSRINAALAPGEEGLGALGPSSVFPVAPGDLAPGGRISAAASDRRYRAALRAGYVSDSAGRGWAMALTVARRWGRDGAIDGVFTDETGVTVSVAKRLGTRHELSLLAVAAPSRTGLRSATTREAYELTGDRLYNPSWGYYNGRVRNTRVRTNLMPAALLGYAAALGRSVRLEVALGGWTGRNGYTTPGWSGAPNPYPDHYATMPGYIANPEVCAEVGRLWRSRDPAVTQVRWDELAAVNALGGGPARYWVEERVTQSRSLQGSATVRARLSPRLTLAAGVDLRADRAGSFKEAKDLLGAAWINDTTLTRSRVPEGGRFGYDYTLMHRALSGHALLSLARGRLRAHAGLEYGITDFERRGPDGGPTAGNGPGRASFGTYMVKLAASYAFSARHSVSATLANGHLAPAADEAFVTPEYRSEQVGGVRPIRVNAAELACDLVWSALRVRLSGYASRTGHETHVYHYYDDLSSTYCNLVLTGIGRLNYGFEAAAEVLFSPRWTLGVAGAVGRYAYCTNPDAAIRNDATGETVVRGTRSYLKGFRVGSTPQTLAAAELRYSGTRMWLASLTVSYMADNWVDPSPVRRMPRVTDRAGSPERFAALTDQERLPEAVTVDLFASKTFRLGGRHRITVNASVRNLLGRRNIVYSGYEQLRVRRTGSGISSSVAPFGSRYYHAYGRGFYAGINYKF